MNDVQVLENNGQRVMTTSVLSECYGTTSDTITKNFNRNKERYVKGKHYYCLEGYELKDFKTNGQIDLSLSKVNKMLNNVDEDEKLLGTVFRSGQSREVWFLTVATSGNEVVRWNI